MTKRPALHSRPCKERGDNASAAIVSHYIPKKPELWHQIQDTSIMERLRMIHEHSLSQNWTMNATQQLYCLTMQHAACVTNCSNFQIMLLTEAAIAVSNGRVSAKNLWPYQGQKPATKFGLDKPEFRVSANTACKCAFHTAQMASSWIQGQPAQCSMLNGWIRCLKHCKTKCARFDRQYSSIIFKMQYQADYVGPPVKFARTAFEC